MLKILIPNNNIDERKYIIDILFDEFLGLEYEIEYGSLNYEIVLENGNKLTIEDHFFNKFPKDLEYLNEENIPKTVEFGKNDFVVEDDIPIIYGTNKPITNSKLTIICPIDIFASSFFMLTRCEEYVNKTRDIHNRFSAHESLAYKNNFLDRPIVNEYVEMLWNILKSLGCKQKRKEKQFELVLTHDVDDILLFRTYKDLIRRVGGDLIRRKNPILAMKTILDYIQTRLGMKNDPYDTFEWLMDMSESIGVKSYFFFMAEGRTDFDNRYKSDSQFVQYLVKKIKKRGHHIGIHPTYDAYNDFKQLKKEKEELEKNLDTQITFGREHYLRFEVPTTWQIWEDNGMEWDSTVGYADKEGFRCGIGDEFSVFNILTREKLKLKEKPLIIMDVTVLNQDVEDKLDLIKSKIKISKNYNAQITLLWHNSNFLEKRKLIKKLYQKSIAI
jgi:hypothetical protein